MRAIDLRHATILLAAVLATALVAFVAAVGASAVDPKAVEATTLSEKRDAVMKRAESYLGTPYDYSYGSCTWKRSQNTMDCDCYTKRVYAKFGHKLAGASVVQQWRYGQTNGKRVWKKSGLRRGDLVFFDTFAPKSMGRSDHVGIYAGKRDGEHIVYHASPHHRQVTVQKLKYMQDYYGAVRLPL